MKLLTYVLLALVCCACLPAKAKDVLIASGHSEYPPFMYKDGDSIVGVGADLTKIIFSELGISVESRHVGAWERVFRQAQSGQIDLIVGAYKTKERERFLVFPKEHYFEEPVVIFINKHNPFDFNRWQDLVDKSGGTVIGESWGVKFDRFAKENLNIQRLVKINHSFKMINRNRLDYAIYALYPGKINLMHLGLENDIIAMPKLVDAPFAYQAFSQKSPFVKHLDYYSRRVKQLKNDGTVQRLIDKHMAHFQRITSEALAAQNASSDKSEPN